MRKACPRCGRIQPCASHPAQAGDTSWNGTRDRSTQRRLRRIVLQRDGHQCAYTVNGQRCQATTQLQAHHLEPGNDDPTMVVTLCREHHKLLDPYAR